MKWTAHNAVGLGIVGYVISKGTAYLEHLAILAGHEEQFARLTNLVAWIYLMLMIALIVWIKNKINGRTKHMNSGHSVKNHYEPHCEWPHERKKK